MVRVVVLALLASGACKKGGEAPPSPLQDATAKAIVIDAVVVADAAVVSKEPPVATKVAVGAHSACAVIGDGTVRCWGKNDHGQLGDNSRNDSPLPVTPKLGGVKDLVVGDDNACALIDDTSVVCWGKIGYGDAADTLAPSAVPGVRGVVRIFLIGGAGCATEKDGGLVCWGDVDARGHITTTGAHHAPAPVPGVDHVLALVARGALRDDGDLTLWVNDGAPVKAGLTRMLEIAQRGDLVCGLDTAGAVTCFGPKTSPCAAPTAAPKPKPKAKPAKPKTKPKKGGKPAKPEPPKPAPEPPADHGPVAFKLAVPLAKHLAFDTGVCVVSTAKQLICADLPLLCAHARLGAPLRPWPALVTVDTMSGACGKLVNGTVRCGMPAAAAAPTISGVAGATQLSASPDGTRGCAILPDKHLACWAGSQTAAPVTF